MVQIYNYQAIKSKYFLRIFYVAIISLVFLAGFVVSIIVPQEKWLTLLIGIAGALICCSARVLLLTRSGAKYRHVKDINNGLTSTDVLVFSHAGEPLSEDFTVYNTLIFKGKDETGREFERELLLEGENPFTGGETVTVCTYRNYIASYGKGLQD